MGESPYRAREPPEADPYLLAWAELRRLERASKWVLAAFFVAIGGSNLFMRSTLSGVACLVFMALVLFPADPFMRRMRRFPCPRCAHPFLDKAARAIGKNAACRHCGIRFGTPKSASAAEFVRVESSPTPRTRVEAPSAVRDADEPVSGEHVSLSEGRR